MPTPGWAAVVSVDIHTNSEAADADTDSLDANPLIQALFPCPLACLLPQALP